jgi:hypothetical protein
MGLPCSKIGEAVAVQLDVSDEEPERRRNLVTPSSCADELERHPYVFIGHRQYSWVLFTSCRGVLPVNGIDSGWRVTEVFESALRFDSPVPDAPAAVVRRSPMHHFGGFADMPWENKTAGGAVAFSGRNPNACSSGNQ